MENTDNIKKAAFLLHSKLDGNLNPSAVYSIIEPFYNGIDGEFLKFQDDVFEYLDKKLFGVVAYKSGLGTKKTIS